MAKFRRLDPHLQLRNDGPRDGDRCVGLLRIPRKVGRIERVSRPSQPILPSHAEPRHGNDRIAQAWPAERVSKLDHGCDRLLRPNDEFCLWQSHVKAFERVHCFRHIAWVVALIVNKTRLVQHRSARRIPSMRHAWMGRRLVADPRFRFFGTDRLPTAGTELLYERVEAKPIVVLCASLQLSEFVAVHEVGCNGGNCARLADHLKSWVLT